MAARRTTLGAIAIALLGLAGCATSEPDARPDPQAGFAYGAFDVTGSDIAVTHVVLLRISPTKVYMGGSGERTTVTYRNGEFYSPNLSPGLYSVNSFYSGNQPFALEGSLRGNTFKVEPGGAVYAGTYKLHYKRKGMLQKDDASFERVDSRASEVQLLRWMSRELAASEWAPRVKARLAALEGR